MAALSRRGVIGRTALFIIMLFMATFLGAVPLSAPAQAQAPYPSRPIRLIVPNPAGGLPDTIARIAGQRLQDRVGQSVVIENRPGANAGIGAAALENAPPDGYSFLVTDGAIFSINPLLYAKLPYDPKAFVPVALLARAPLFLAAHAKVPVANMKELIDYIKAHPDELTYGTIGVGSFHHLSMEAIKSALGLKVTHVPFKGSGESVSAFLGGHVDLLFASYAALSGAVEAKQVRLLASNGAQRSPSAPDVPPVADFIPGFDLAVTQGLFARAGTAADIVTKIGGDVAAVMKEPDVAAQLLKLGIEPVGAGPDELDKALKSETDRVSKVVQALGLKPQ